MGSLPVTSSYRRSSRSSSNQQLSFLLGWCLVSGAALMMLVVATTHRSSMHCWHVTVSSSGGPQKPRVLAAALQQQQQQHQPAAAKIQLDSCPSRVTPFPQTFWVSRTQLGTWCWCLKQCVAEAACVTRCWCGVGFDLGQLLAVVSSSYCCRSPHCCCCLHSTSRPTRPAPQPSPASSAQSLPTTASHPCGETCCTQHRGTSSNLADQTRRITRSSKRRLIWRTKPPRFQQWGLSTT